MLALVLSLAAMADPIGEEDDGDDLDLPNRTSQKTEGETWGIQKEKLKLSVDDDEVMQDFVAEAKKKAPPPVWFHLDVAGKKPLEDTFDIQVTAYNNSFVVVELPVLVSITRGTFLAEHPNGIVVVAEITSGSLRRVITETVPPDAVYEVLPTLVFLKTALPTSAATGEVRYLVKVGELPAPPPVAAAGAKPPPPPEPAAPPKDRFARTTVFRKPQ